MNIVSLYCQLYAACVKTKSAANAALWQTAGASVLLGGGGHADEAAALAFVVEVHDAVDLREERVIAAHADVHTGVELRSPLAHEDRSTSHELTGEALDAEHL